MDAAAQRVLIVDDESSIRTLLSLIIGNHPGYSVSLAEDGASALRSIERETPDVLLTDMHMPGMTGTELMTTVRSRYPTVRVIAMSGTHSGDGVPEGLRADAFYLKNGRNWMELIEILKAPRLEAQGVDRPTSLSSKSDTQFLEGVRVEQAGVDGHGSFTQKS